MRIWRLTRARYAGSAFSGEGGLHRDGRWHRRGVRVVYASESLALAVLEVLVHVDPEYLPEHVAVLAHIPDHVAVNELTEDQLPEDWRAIPPPRACQTLGTEWVQGSASPVLRVPSVVIPREYNYLLNPLHPVFGDVILGTPEPFSFDPRLW